MTNAAKFAGVEEIDVYAEVTEEAVSVFVRDRGAGFDRAPCGRPPRARRVDRGSPGARGGPATIVSSPANGTEVELRLPRRAS